MIERKKEIENRLNDYCNLDYKIKMLEIKLERQKMKGSPRDIGAIDFGKIGHGSGGNKSAQSILLDVQKTIIDINDLKYEKQTINNFIEMLKNESSEQYNFVRLYYFDKKSINETLNELGYSYNSRNTIYRIKKEIFAKFDKYDI